jgi:sigma-B regulation protein RsbU (phosphoserine phosphatase)
MTSSRTESIRAGRPWLRLLSGDAENESEAVVALFRALLAALVLISPAAVGAMPAGGSRFYWVAGSAAVYSLVVGLMLSRRVQWKARRPLELGLDIAYLTLLIHYTGGLRGGGGLFGLYYLTVIVGSMWFGVVGSIGAAALATLCYVLVLVYAGPSNPWERFHQLQRLMMPHAVLLFLAAVLTAYLAEAWRHERRQVGEHRAVLDQFKKQMDMAQELQTLILPPALPNAPGVEVGVRTRQADLGVGGDYYDAVVFADGAVGICIADVSGHGVTGQLRLPLVKYAFRVCAQHYRQPEVVIPNLNQLLCRELPPDMNVGMVYAVIEPQRNRIKMCRAGLWPPLLLVASNAETRELWQPAGVVLGVEPDLKYDVARIPFLPDDYLVFYTDGAVEAQNLRGKQLDIDGLVTMLGQATPESAQDLANWLFGELADYERGAKRDDLTLVVVRRTAL